MSHRFVGGMPTGTAAWRQRVAEGAAGLLPANAVALDFVLPPRRWVDVDTLAETTLKGLRDAAVLPPRYAGLDALLATKTNGAPSGVRIATVTPRTIARRAAPGECLLDLRSALLPRPGNRAVKRAWRNALAGSWGRKAPLRGPVWAAVEMPVSGSLVAPLEVVLDALEPVLGRDPRGSSWQEFFPNDHLIVWLKVVRCAPERGLGLRMGHVS